MPLLGGKPTLPWHYASVEINEHIDALRVAGDRLAAVVAESNLDAPVPPCPGWDVRELVRHLGGIHRWATRYVTEARMAVIEDELEQIAGGWPRDADLVDWFRDGHGHLVRALEHAPADLECFTFLQAPSPLAMWARRQAHETSIHRLDAESASNAITPFRRDMALDGIDELVVAFITRRGRGPRSPLPTSLALVPTDASLRWTVFFDSESCRTEREEREAAVTVSGEASDLYAWVWNRPTIDEVTIDGDPAVARIWSEKVHVRWG